MNPVETTEKVSDSQAMRYTGWVILYPTLIVPIGVILWRLATMPWGGQ